MPRTHLHEETHEIERRLKDGDIRRCRICGCTDLDCRLCIERTGEPCHWVEVDLCSACSSQD